MRRPDGTEVWIEATPRLLHDLETGAPDGYVAISRDVSERRYMEVERELRRREPEAANHQLERLARHLGRTRELADQAKKAKSRFLAGMSHELRTPLNGIFGYAQPLRMEGPLAGKQGERVDAMLGAGQHLLEMINRVLDLSETMAETFKTQASAIDLQQVARMCLGLVGLAAKAKRLALTLATDPRIPECVLADPARLRQLLLNLLGNAVKFTDQGGVELRLLATDGTTLRVGVADSGPGMLPRQRQLLFQDCERPDASGLVEGAGLGLAISVRLAALMDVRIPGMDGLEATRRLRAVPGPRGQVPIIALTAQPFAEQVEECRRAGMDGHIAKPFTQTRHRRRRKRRPVRGRACPGRQRRHVRVSAPRLRGTRVRARGRNIVARDAGHHPRPVVAAIEGSVREMRSRARADGAEPVNAEETANVSR